MNYFSLIDIILHYINMTQKILLNRIGRTLNVIICFSAIPITQHVQNTLAMRKI